MRLARPIYCSLPACRGRSYEEIEELTREVYRRNPRLSFYPLLAVIVLIPLGYLAPRFLEAWWTIEKPWSLLVPGLLIGIPMIVFEWRFHVPAVNREFEKLSAERGRSAPPV
jgi:hypothetical protein